MIMGPRPVRPSEYPGMLKLINDCIYSGKGTRGMEDVYPVHLKRSNLANLWVMVEDGRVVSHVGVAKTSTSILGARVPVVLMSSVATDPKYRGLGLASRIIEHVRRVHDRQGFDLYMISGDLSIYRRIGGAAAGRMMHFVLPRAALKPFGHPDVTVRPAEAKDLKVIASLYNRERLRLIRSPEIYRRVFRTGWAAFKPTRLYLAEAEGKPTAYFATTVTGKVGGPPREGRMTVIEVAGSRTDLLAALEAACRKWNKHRVEMHASSADRDSLALLSDRRLAELPVPVYPCTAIINMARLIQRLRPLLVTRAGPTARRLTGSEHEGLMVLQLGSRRVSLKAEAMARLIFGEPKRDRPPGIRAAGELGRVIRTALPVPLANPGISYM